MSEIEKGLVTGRIDCQRPKGYIPDCIKGLVSGKSSDYSNVECVIDEECMLSGGRYLDTCGTSSVLIKTPSVGIFIPPTDDSTKFIDNLLSTGISPNCVFTHHVDRNKVDAIVTELRKDLELD